MWLEYFEQRNSLIQSGNATQASCNDISSLYFVDICWQRYKRQILKHFWCIFYSKAQVPLAVTRRLSVESSIALLVGKKQINLDVLKIAFTRYKETTQTSCTAFQLAIYKWINVRKMIPLSPLSRLQAFHLLHRIQSMRTH